MQPGRSILYVCYLLHAPYQSKFSGHMGGNLRPTSQHCFTSHYHLKSFIHIKALSLHTGSKRSSGLTAILK